MTRKNKNLLTIGLVAAGVYLITQKPATTTQPPYYSLQQVPPAPAPNTQAWQQWVATIVQSFGTVASLWAPGGPFYQQPLSQAQALEIGSGQQYSNMAGIGAIDKKKLHESVAKTLRYAGYNARMFTDGNQYKVKVNGISPNELQQVQKMVKSMYRNLAVKIV